MNALQNTVFSLEQAAAVSKRERRQWLQKLFVRLLMRLCRSVPLSLPEFGHPFLGICTKPFPENEALSLPACSYVPAVEELARKDDLTLLFLAVTSTCPGHNVAW